MKKRNYKAVMSIIFIAVFKIGICQNSSLFIKDYYRLGVFVQLGKDYNGHVFKEDNSIGYDVLDFKSYQIGFIYNIYQYKNFNFKTGLILKFKKIKEHVFFSKEQTGFDNDINFTSIEYSASKMKAIPLIFEYIFSLSNKIKWLVSGSYTFAYYTGQEGEAGYIHGLNPTPAALFIYYDGYDKNPLFTSAEISTGFYFLFKHFMLQPEIRYSKSFRDVLTGHYITENFVTEPHNSSGTFKQSGDYWGVSLSVYIKKRGKNKKRKKHKK